MDWLCWLGLHDWRRIKLGNLFRCCLVCTYQQIWDEERHEWADTRE